MTSFALFGPLALAVAVFSVLPYAGARGRARLAERDDDALRATHEHMLQNTTPGLAISFAGLSLVLALAQGRLGEAAAHVVVAAAAVLCLRAYRNATRNVSEEMRSRSLSPEPQLPRSVRRQRRTRQIGFVSFAAFGLAGLIAFVAPVESAWVALSGGLMLLAVLGLLAMGIASAWVYGDEETDEPTART